MVSLTRSYPWPQNFHIYSIQDMLRGPHKNQLNIYGELRAWLRLTILDQSQIKNARVQLFANLVKDKTEKLVGRYIHAEKHSKGKKHIIVEIK